MSGRRCAALLAAILAAGIWPGAAVRAQTPAVIAVIVPASARVQTLESEVLALIYRRKKLLWDGSRRAVPVNLPADHPLRQRFSRAVLGAAPEDLEDYWNQQYFQGLLPPHVLASEAAVLRFVGGTEGAVGYMPLCEVDRSVRVLLLIDPEGGLHAPGEVQDTNCPGVP